MTDTPDRTDRRSRTPASVARRTLSALAAAALLTALASLALAQVAVGDRLVDEGRFDEAVAAYGEALASDPDDSVALLRRARAQVYRADELPSAEAETKELLYERAIADAERAAELAPNDPNAHMEVARALGRAAQYRGVLASLNLAARVSDALDRVFELDPDHASAWHAHALFHHEVPWIAGGRGGLVVPSFERAIEAEPREIAHRVAFARVLIDREAWDEAEAQLDAALALSPRSYLDRQDLEAARELRDRLR